MLYGDRFGHILALEPDPANFAKLQSAVAALPPLAAAKVECRRAALASERTILYLDATGTASSTASAVPSTGAIAVTAETLDALIDGSRPTLVKLDVEGFEINALEGARETIQRHGPVLAICVYHRQNHLWKIPLLVRQWRDDYAFFLRPHNEEGWDLVCYAVPRTRLRGHAS